MSMLGIPNSRFSQRRHCEIHLFANIVFYEFLDSFFLFFEGGIVFLVLHTLKTSVKANGFSVWGRISRCGSGHVKDHRFFDQESITADSLIAGSMTDVWDQCSWQVGAADFPECLGLRQQGVSAKYPTNVPYLNFSRSPGPCHSLASMDLARLSSCHCSGRPWSRNTTASAMCFIWRRGERTGSGPPEEFALKRV